MTQQFIGTKVVTAWPETKDMQPGYAVKYENGYISFSPKETFEAAYRVAEGTNQSLTFGDAVHFLKQGQRVTRRGWNGKGMWLYMVPANSYPAQTDAAKSHIGDTVPYRAYIAMKTAQGDVVPWIASQSDILESDWSLVGHK